MVEKNEFREDLYWRVSGKKITLPPLRDRVEDIEDLTLFFLANEKPRRNKKFDEDGIAALKDYSWPGNVRELKRVCEQLSLISPLPIIRSIDVFSILKPHSVSRFLKKVDFNIGLNELVSNYENQMIQDCLRKNNNDIDLVAEILKISRSNLYKKIKDFQINLS
jgi:transcriptional regulator with PAS, ATPase and Fis domain